MYYQIELKIGNDVVGTVEIESVPGGEVYVDIPQQTFSEKHYYLIALNYYDYQSFIGLIQDEEGELYMIHDNDVYEMYDYGNGTEHELQLKTIPNEKHYYDLLKEYLLF